MKLIVWTEYLAVFAIEKTPHSGFKRGADVRSNMAAIAAGRNFLSSMEHNSETFTIDFSLPRIDRLLRLNSRETNEKT